MAEPENHTLELLRGIRAMLDRIQATLEEHSEQFSALRKEMHDWQDTIATSTGFAMHAHVRTKTVEEELAALSKRVDRLEQALKPH